MNIYKGEYNYAIQSEYDEETATVTLTEARKEAINLSKALSSPIYIVKINDGDGDEIIYEYINGKRTK